MAWPAPVASRTIDTRAAAVTSMRAVASRPPGLISQTNVSLSLTQYATTVERRRAAVATICGNVAGAAPGRAVVVASSRRLPAGEQIEERPRPRALGGLDRLSCAALCLQEGNAGRKDPLVSLTEAALEEVVGDGVNPQILDGRQRTLQVRRRRLESAERLERPCARRQHHGNVVGRHPLRLRDRLLRGFQGARLETEPDIRVGELGQPLHPVLARRRDGLLERRSGLLVATERVVDPGDVPAQEVDVSI